MEMQRGPRGLRDREYPEDVHGHIDGSSEPVGGGEQTGNEPVEGEAPEGADDVTGHLRPSEAIEDDDVEGHLSRPTAIGDQRDDRER